MMYHDRFLPQQDSTIYLDLEPETSRLATSSVRLDERSRYRTASPLAPPPIVEPRYDPLGIFKQAEEDAQRKALLASTSYCTNVPRLHEVARGVLSDGTHTIRHPAVRHFLASAKSHPSIKPPTSATTFVLAALAVFYHPTEPPHWIFWSKEKKVGTARVVQSVLSESLI